MKKNDYDKKMDNLKNAAVCLLALMVGAFILILITMSYWVPILDR